MAFAMEGGWLHACWTHPGTPGSQMGSYTSPEAQGFQGCSLRGRLSLVRRAWDVNSRSPSRQGQRLKQRILGWVVALAVRIKWKHWVQVEVYSPLGVEVSQGSFWWNYPRMHSTDTIELKAACTLRAWKLSGVHLHGFWYWKPGGGWG